MGGSGTSLSLVPGFAVINITVMDLNDHIPTFLNPLPSIEISERVDIGEILTDFDVSDSDSGDLGEDGVRFAIVAGTVSLKLIRQVLILSSLVLFLWQEILICSQWIMSLVS